MIHRVLGPEPADQRQGLVEPGGPLLPRDAERLLLVGVDHAQPERGQHAPTGQPVETRELLRHQYRVAPGQHHHARPQLELGRAARRVGKSHERVERGARDPLGEPE